jgi:hypothetical protein
VSSSILRTQNNSTVFINRNVNDLIVKNETGKIVLGKVH